MRRLDPVEWADVDWHAVCDQPEAAVHPATDVDAKADGAAVVRGDGVAHQRLEAPVHVCVRAQDEAGIGRCVGDVDVAGADSVENGLLAMRSPRSSYESLRTSAKGRRRCFDRLSTNGG